MVRGMISPSSSLQGTRLAFTGKQQVHLEAFELASPAEGEVLVRTQFSPANRDRAKTMGILFDWRTA